MRKPTFGVTAFVVVTLSLVGIFRVGYKPLLPPSPTEYLVTLPTTEPLPAPIVEINWRRSVEQARADAKRRKIGILFLFIEPSNSYSKQIELRVFRDPEMARFVNRSFVPVKINLDQYPEWGQVTLPKRRLTNYYEPGVELVVTSQDGSLINHYVIENPFQYYGPESVLSFLIESKANINKGQSFLQSEFSLRSMQVSGQRALISTTPEVLPAFSEFEESLFQGLKMNSNGTLGLGSSKVPSLELRFLAKLGKGSFSATFMKQLALTPLYDPIDGGFYREARVNQNSSYIDTGKSSSGNALAALVTAQLACLESDNDLKNLAIDIGNEVISDFSDGESICTSRMNDQLADSRSRRSSLTEKKLNSILSQDQRTRLMSFVTKSKSPDQDLLSLKSLSALSNSDFVTVRQELRESLRSVPGLSEPEHIALDGYLAARLFELYRYTDDPRFLTKGRELSENTFSALSTNSVAKIYGNRQLGKGWLGSYLAVADCGLAHFAATGEIYPLRKGEIALKLAISKFRDEQTGLLNNVAKDPASTFAFAPTTPDLADRDREALNSQAIRLAFHYSVTSESKESRAEFLAFAQSMMVRLNAFMHIANDSASGYYDAVFDVVDSTSIMVAGPNRVSNSNRLAKRFPLRLVYPLSLPEAPPTDLLYIRRGETLEGPLSEKEIQKKLSETSGT